MAKIAKDKTDISTLTQQLITLSIPAIYLSSTTLGHRTLQYSNMQCSKIS